MLRKSSSAVRVDARYLPKVSLLICAYNEEDVIAKKTENALKIDYPSGKLEIIVFDNGSEDGTFEIASSFKDNRLKVLKLRGKNRGKSAGVNEALKSVTGEIVKISDADCLYEKDILRKIIPYFGDPSVGAVCICQSLINPQEKLTVRLERSLQAFYQLFHGAESAVDSVIVGEGGLTFRRNLIDELDESTGADDVDLAVRIRKSGHRVLYLKDAHYYEYTPTTFRSRWRQKIRRSAMIIRTLVRHRRVMFDKDLGVYGRVIYPAEFFIHAVSPYVFVAVLGLGIALLILNPLEFMIAFLCILVVGILMGAWLAKYTNLDSEGGSLVCFLATFLTFVESNVVLFLGSLSLVWGKSSVWVPERSDARLKVPVVRK